MDSSHPLPPSGVENSHTRPWQRMLHYIAYTAFIAAGLLPPIAQYIAKHLLKEKGYYWAFSAYATQVIVLLILLIVAAFQKPKVNYEAYAHASNAVNEFKSPWVGLWFSWFLFYLLLSAQEFLHATHKAPGDSAYWDPLLNMLNNFQTICVLLCYVAIYFPTLKDENTPSNSDSTTDHIPLGFLFVVLLAVVALITVGNYVYILIKSPIPDTRVDIGCMMFRLISGASLGISLALLVGQFDSRYLEASRISIAALYLYAVIQFSYTDFGRLEATSERIFTTISLPLKLVLFALVYNFLKTWRMLFLMEKARVTYKNAPKEWGEFEASLQPIARDAVAVSATRTSRRH